MWRLNKVLDCSPKAHQRSKRNQFSLVNGCRKNKLSINNMKIIDIVLFPFFIICSLLLHCRYFRRSTFFFQFLLHFQKSMLKCQYGYWKVYTLILCYINYETVWSIISILNLTTNNSIHILRLNIKTFYYNVFFKIISWYTWFSYESNVK